VWQNLVLSADTATSDPSESAAARIARRALEQRGATLADEVRRLLDAALEVMRRRGTSSKPRVADIVAEAGLSNEAFYRHFPSKDALVSAILEDGAERLASYLSHQMEKETTPEGKVGSWVAGVLSQADADIAAPTLAVLWNAGNVSDGIAAGRHPAHAALVTLLREPFAALGAADAELDASLVAHAVLGTLSDHLWQRTPFTADELRQITAFAVAAGRRRL
jgi:AcrR family transcriptional regulator